jgi:quercetin dioxygenase-like cupin family protein
MEKHLWGTTTDNFVSPALALVQFSAEEGGRSSLHYHDRKNNIVIVTSGIVEIYAADCRLMRRLEAGEMFVVHNGVPHQLRFVTDAQGYEIFTPSAGGPINMDDIVRKEDGRVGCKEARRLAAIAEDKRRGGRKHYKKVKKTKKAKVAKVAKVAKNKRAKKVNSALGLG